MRSKRTVKRAAEVASPIAFVHPIPVRQYINLELNKFHSVIPLSPLLLPSKRFSLHLPRPKVNSLAQTMLMSVAHVEKETARGSCCCCFFSVQNTKVWDNTKAVAITVSPSVRPFSGSFHHRTLTMAPMVSEPLTFGCHKIDSKRPRNRTNQY